jgi:hypothetical protein
MRLRLALVAALTLLGVAAAPARANTVTPSCTLPGLVTVDCASWHSSNVTLRWTWSPPGEDAASSGCLPTTFRTDTPAEGSTVVCTVYWGFDFAGAQATVRVDKTPPKVTGATPARPPDYGGWYNHPVALAFQGSDALSGLAGCDSVVYSGPGGAGAPVTGGCRDLAGNRATASFPINYDATPPAPPQVQALPGNRGVRVSWVAPPDASQVVVSRSGPTGSAAAKTIYRGHGDAVRDHGLKNGVRYRYTVTVLDQAGNRSSAAITAMPTASTLRPLTGSVVSAPPRLTWKAVRGASYYNVQLYRGKHKVLSAWPHGNHLQLKPSWRLGGRSQRLSPGAYRWYVWPGYGARPEHRYGRLLGQSGFRVSR